MHYLLIFVAFMLLIYGPSLWVKFVIHKHNKPLVGMPGSGAELAEHLIARFELDGVVVKKTTQNQNYYSPQEKTVGLSPDAYDGKSISAIAIAAHEVGHAIQYHRAEPVSQLRSKYTGLAAGAQRLGIMVLGAAPFLGLLTRAPSITVFVLIAGVLAMLGSVAMYAMILPEEYDASFGKALPLLNEGYLPPEYMPAATQVLKACALTYVAAALASIFSLWRWIAILR